MIRTVTAAVLALALTIGSAIGAFAAPPSVPPASAPQLAALGPDPVGVYAATWGDKDRPLRVVIWAPAAQAGEPRGYPGTIPAGPTWPAIPYTLPALASPDVSPKPGRYPLVVMSHGFGGRAENMSWLGENLASKGYIVVAPDHADRPLEAKGALSEALVRRATDVAAVARAVLADPAWRTRIDASRIAVVGYSMGGYATLRVAGAPFDPTGGAAKYAGAEAIAPLTQGGRLDKGPLVANVRAIVLIAPWGGQANIGAFSAKALGSITTPTLVLAGDRDDISGYADGVATIYQRLTHAPRAMVTFENAGHTIGAAPLPPEGAAYAPVEGFFLDPVWRKERVHAIATHFVTAHLDAQLKGDAARAAFLALPNGRAADGVWPVAPGTPAPTGFAADQPGVTVWRGFQRRWAEGLTFRSDPPAP